MSKRIPSPAEQLAVDGIGAVEDPVSIVRQARLSAASSAVRRAILPVPRLSRPGRCLQVLGVCGPRRDWLRIALLARHT